VISEPAHRFVAATPATLQAEFERTGYSPDPVSGAAKRGPRRISQLSNRCRDPHTKEEPTGSSVYTCGSPHRAMAAKFNVVFLASIPRMGRLN
jgi:hypothetical protein